MHAQQPPTPFEARKAKVLLRTQLPCLGCHELDGEGGKSAPSLSTVGARRSAKYIRAIIEDPQQTLPGSAMPRHPMEGPVREIVIRFLANNATGADQPALAGPRSTTASPSGPPSASPSGPPSASTAAAAPAAPNGVALYARWCASCHGASGMGDGPDARRLPVAPARHADAAAMSKRPDDSLYDVIAVGGPPYGRSARMPAFGATLSSSEIRALVAQIRLLCKCQGPAWSRHGAGK
jgi:mono/diheme cytochrome c family protein